MTTSGRHTRADQRQAYVTKDGCSIRELMHPLLDSCRRQSLAEATLAARAKSALHRHRSSEEIYHIVAGEGIMTLAEETFEVTAGDTVLITPGTAHCIANTGDTELKLLCCCSPAYQHSDTDLL